MNNLRVEQIFSDRASGWSERTAIQIGDRSVSYCELDKRSNQLARRLIEAGLGRGRIAAVATGDIEHFALAVLAILKAGAAYLPIDTRYPVDRVRDILADAAPVILLATAEFPGRLIPAGLLVVRDFADASLDTFSDRPIDVADGVDDVACIYFTSGSTGRPKGIEVAHRGIPNLVGDRDFLPFGPDDRVGQASNFAFDALTFELWGALLNGGCVVHMPKQVLFSATELARFLRLERISVIWLTTSLFNALSSSRPDAFEALDVLVIGGEAADPNAVSNVLRSGRPPRRLLNAYGPTEATTFATWHEVTLQDVDANRVPIGKAVLGMRIHLVNEAMASVRRGEPGELLIGGPGVAIGYLNQPAATSERFVADCFDAKSSGRLFRTGDLCRELPDGSIEFLGRMDDQVKIRGFRVEPLEVAATLRQLAGVEDAVVLARPAAFGTRDLVAFVRSNATCSVEQLRREAANLLPDYMVPSIIRTVVSFPLTASGKLDRAALLATIRAGGPHIRQQEDEDIEKRLVATWSNVLQRDDIGIDQEFRELGGDSLSTMNLALEIEAEFDVVLSVDDLATSLTISKLAAKLRERRPDVSLHASTSTSPENEPSPKVFGISYPWIMSPMPEEITQALSFGKPRQVQVPFTYFRKTDEVTIEDMAIQVERQIYTLATEGPYVLYGQCLAGFLAYEVARRLVAAGHSVSMLIIVDSYPFFDFTWSRWAKVLPKKIANFSSLDLAAQYDKLREKIFPPRPANYQDFIKDACHRAQLRYRPCRYSGRAAFFRHRLNGSLVNQDPTAWRKLVQGQLAEFVVDFHDGGKVTSASAKSGYREIAAKLKEMGLDGM